MSASHEVGWVIVRYAGGAVLPEYFTLQDGEDRWSANNADAVRFARKDDAERMLAAERAMLRVWGFVLDARVEDHAWVPRDGRETP